MMTLPGFHALSATQCDEAWSLFEDGSINITFSLSGLLHPLSPVTCQPSLFSQEVILRMSNQSKVIDNFFVPSGQVEFSAAIHCRDRAIHPRPVGTPG